MSDLLPCPCCGGKARFQTTDDLEWVVCVSCGLMTQSMEEADASVKLWNTRSDVELAAVKAERDELKEQRDNAIREMDATHIENNRLREALREIQARSIDCYVMSIARKALEGKR